MDTSAWTPKAIARFEAKIDHRPDGCWIFTSNITKDGYAHFWLAGKGHSAHRLSFERRNGYLPQKPMVIDHLCRNRACVNPDHLEVVHELVNIHRGERKYNGICRRGHVLTRDNTIIRQPAATRPGSLPYVNCRQCYNESQKRRYERDKAAGTMRDRSAATRRAKHAAIEELGDEIREKETA